MEDKKRVLSMYQWSQVKLLKENGYSIKQIVKELKISRNTVRKYLRDKKPPQFQSRVYHKKILDYEKEIQEMKNKGFIGTRIYAELQKLGFEGSLSVVHRYLQKQERRKETKVTTRVETAPGKQMQYDWKEWLLPVDGQLVKIYIHDLILSNSRKKYFTYSLSIKSNDIIRAIKQGVEYFGGSAEQLVIDNPKQMVIVHKPTGFVRYNDDFMKFCTLYGIQPSACKYYRARTKGKVERPFFFVQEHLLRGLEVNSLAEFDKALEDFMSFYNSRVHSTLEESPDKLFELEKNHLRALPLIEQLFNYELRKVSNDGYVACNGNHYPVPMSLSLQTVKTEIIFGRTLRVYNTKGELACEHKLNPIKSKQKPLHPEHQVINQQITDKKEGAKLKLTKKFVNIFSDIGEQYLEKLKEEHSGNVYWHVSEILSYLDYYPVEQIKEVLSFCLKAGGYHKNNVKRLLNHKPMTIVEPTLFNLSIETVNINRPLSEYGGLR